MKHIKGTIIIFVMTTCAMMCMSCEKEPSPHLETALLMMEGHTDYTDPVFEDVLMELRQVPKNDPNYARAQEVIRRIEGVRGYIYETRKIEEAERRQREEELEKYQREREEWLKEIQRRKSSRFRQSDAERELNDKLNEMKLLEQQLIREQEAQMMNNQVHGTPTPNPFRFTPTDDKGRGEEYWRRRNDLLNSQLRNLESRLANLERKLETLESSGLPRHQLLKNREERDQVLVQIDDVKAEIESKKRDIEDLKDDLHKAGGMPGWIR